MSGKIERSLFERVKRLQNAFIKRNLHITAQRRWYFRVVGQRERLTVIIYRTSEPALAFASASSPSARTRATATSRRLTLPVGLNVDPLALIMPSGMKL
jgi:hypothetical protein